MGGIRELQSVSLSASSTTRLSDAAAASIQRICAMVFVDVECFTRIPERDIPGFVDRYFWGVLNVLRRTKSAPLAQNTWGDGLHLVYPGVREAGLFALAFQDFLRGVKRSTGDSPPVRVRIGLHAGPVYELFDPIIGRRNYLGEHVNRAARLEPATPPGEIYASRNFAALAAAEGVPEFRCLEVGFLLGAKESGRFQAFRVERTPRSPR
jgi:class 3 adenylate cyclase